MNSWIALLLLAAVPAFAHAKLTGAIPASETSVKSPPLIKLQFSEPLEPAFSGAALTGPDGNPIPVSVSVGATGITLIPGTLKPGQYGVTWHSGGHDTHRVTGTVRLKVIP